MDNNPTGRLYNIQGFSVQDGPGIRTTAFLKGCPLHCPWCHSPESQRYEKQLSWIEAKCLGLDACSERCLKTCPHRALEAGAEKLSSDGSGRLRFVHVKRESCSDCGQCAEVCYAGALSVCGIDYTAEDLTKRLLQDRVFYEQSGGGVTLSGGEPLSQIEFTVDVLKRLKAEGVHTALDTTGFASWDTVSRTIPYSDLYLYDLKHMDSERHQAVVGVPNEPILRNACKLAEHGAHLQIRIPVIPGFNDSEENIRECARFCAELGPAVSLIQLLPYHNLGVTKYLRISDRKAVECTVPGDEKMQCLKAIFDEKKLPASIH